MSMSTYVRGVCDDRLYEDYKLIYYKCKLLGLSIPEEVLEYFSYFEPENIGGKIINLPEEAWGEFSENSTDIIEVDLTKIPKHVKFLRFCNSY